MNKYKQECLKIGEEWLERPIDDIFNNIPLIIDAMVECNDSAIWGTPDKLVQAILSIPSEKLIDALVLYLDQTDKAYLHIDDMSFSEVWFKLALSPVSRQQLIIRLFNVKFDSYVFTFLNGIDGGDDTPGEKAIRGILNELGYPITRDTSQDWSPCRRYRRVTMRALAEMLEDPIANFSRLIDSLFCPYADYWDYLVDHVLDHLYSIPPETLVSLLISDMHRRQAAYPVPSDYTSIWLSLANADEPEELKFVDALVNQLAGLSLDSCVVVYLNTVYAQKKAEGIKNPIFANPLLDGLRDVLERANVFTNLVADDCQQWRYY